MSNERVRSLAWSTLIALAGVLLLITGMASASTPAGTTSGPPLDLAPTGEAQLQLSVPNDLLAQTQWAKWVNGVPWRSGLRVTVETSDTIRVTDVITPLPSESQTLVERWPTASLKLLDYEAAQTGSPIEVSEGKLTWQIPEGAAKPYTLTKWFHVEPCTWLEATLSETLSIGSRPAEERAVTLAKEPPVLSIDSAYDASVYPGDVATLTLSYGNGRGYENDVWIRSVFPDMGTFAWSDPPADEVAPDGLSARWSLGDLSRNGQGHIAIGVAISDAAPIGAPIEIVSEIHDHVDAQRDQVVSAFVPAALPDAQWNKSVNGQPWSPDLVVTAPTSDTITIVDTIESGQAFQLMEFWDPALLRLTDVQYTAGAVVSDAGTLEWTLTAAPSGPVSLTKTFHVEPGPWPLAFVEELLHVAGARDPMVRVVPIEHPFPAIVFPEGEWPWYAQDEISVHPEPPISGEPAELCAQVINRDTEHARGIAIEFAVAHFGIGLPFMPVGRAEVMVPPGGEGTGCTMWVPPTPDHWCIEARLLGDSGPYMISRRNVDVDEPLAPLTAHARAFPVRNPTDHPVTITLGLIPHFPDWGLELSQDVLPNMQPGETRQVTLTVTPPADMPAAGDVIVDVEAFVGGELIGGFRKVYRPPVVLHPFPDPVYAEREITIEPYPLLVGRPSEICVELRNPTAAPQETLVQFSWAYFGIGLPFTPIDGLRPVRLPPHSVVRECIHWVPPLSGSACLQVELRLPGHEPQRSRRNLDVDEPLRRRVPHARTFPVRNPTDQPVTITLGLVPHLPDWGLELSQDVLPNVPPGEVREVTLTVTPPDDLPDDGQPIVDVEAFVAGELIGGFRKVYRPPVVLHPFPDPIYAEREITIEPYPLLAGRPSEVCVELRNPMPTPREAAVQFSWARLGIGLPFVPIDGLRPVALPPHSVVRECIHWVPPISGSACLQVELQVEGHQPQRSRRNVDVDEPLAPLTPHARAFPVRNPTDHPVTITLGLIPHFPDWGLELSQDVLPNMAPGETRPITLTVTPPADMPADGDAIVDVEAYADGRLIGGIRKIYRPPVPIHHPRDPVYAESEIMVDPYPAIPGVPTRLGVEVFNPTDRDQTVQATFSVASFGIGLPPTTTHIAPNPVAIFVPAHGAARGHTIWTPPNRRGRFCVRVTLRMEGHEPIWSQRNIDVGEPLRPGEPHELPFALGTWPYTRPVTITLGLVPHKEGWGFELAQDTYANVQPGQQVQGILTVTPRPGTELGTGDPIVDVEAFVEGELLGGFRKLDIPPVPLHKPHERGYAESEISIVPYPPQKGQPTTVSTVVQNSSDMTMTVDLTFGWARFGMGIPFSTTGMLPPTRTLTLSPASADTASVTWTPVYSGHQCVRVLLSDRDGTYEPQESQRNVDVALRPPCDVTKVFTFTVYNDSAFTVTVQIGLITFNVPQDWEVTTVPSDTLEIGPFDSGVITVMINIPCAQTQATALAQQAIQAIQQAAGSVPTIDVEGYVDGALVGGIEIQFPEGDTGRWIYLPAVFREHAP